jgi:hypothetical protein
VPVKFVIVTVMAWEVLPSRTEPKDKVVGVTDTVGVSVIFATKAEALLAGSEPVKLD